MKYLIYDITANGKPKDYKAPFSDTFSWPRMVHISWIILDAELKLVEDFDCVIRPEGFVIDERLAKLAHLDEEDIKTKSSPLSVVLDQFDKSVDQVEYTISHNNASQQNILAAEYIRLNRQPKHFRTEGICLMREATYFCKIPNKRGGGYKWPSMQELYATLFNQKYSPSNNARADVIAATRSFKKLMLLGELQDVFDED